MKVEFQAQLWEWSARSDTWTFVSVPVEDSEEIRELMSGFAEAPRRGFGSVRVRARIGTTTWTTSIFPDSGRRAYVLPVKRAVRTAQGLETGDVTTVSIELLDL